MYLYTCKYRYNAWGPANDGSAAEYAATFSEQLLPDLTSLKNLVVCLGFRVRDLGLEGGRDRDNEGSNRRQRDGERDSAFFGATAPRFDVV